MLKSNNILFSPFKPRDVLKRICFLIFHKSCIQLHVLKGTSIGGLKWETNKVQTNNVFYPKTAERGRKVILSILSLSTTACLKVYNCSREWPFNFCG